MKFQNFQHFHIFVKTQRTIELLKFLVEIFKKFLEFSMNFVEFLKHQKNMKFFRTFAYSQNTTTVLESQKFLNKDQKKANHVLLLVFSRESAENFQEFSKIKNFVEFSMNFQELSKNFLEFQKKNQKQI